MKITIELDTDILTPEQLTAVGMLIPSPFAVKREEKPKTIKRADLRLKDGDAVMLRDGEGPFTCRQRSGPFSSAFPFDIGRQYLAANGGYFFHDPSPQEGDAISVNGIHIED